MYGVSWNTPTTLVRRTPFLAHATGIAFSQKFHNRILCHLPKVVFKNLRKISICMRIATGKRYNRVLLLIFYQYLLIFIDNYQRLLIFIDKYQEYRYRKSIDIEKNIENKFLILHSGCILRTPCIGTEQYNHWSIIIIFIIIIIIIAAGDCYKSVECNVIHTKKIVHSALC